MACAIQNDLHTRGFALYPAPLRRFDWLRIVSLDYDQLKVHYIYIHTHTHTHTRIYAQNDLRQRGFALYPAPLRRFDWLRIVPATLTMVLLFLSTRK